MQGCLKSLFIRSLGQFQELVQHLFSLIQVFFL